MEIRLVPYCEIDGIRSFSDSEIAELYDRMEHDGTAGTVFYCGSVKNRSGFVVKMKEPGTYLYVIMRRGDPEGITEKLGIVWLNRIEYKRAYFHFCLFSNAWGKKSEEIGKDVVSELINMRGRDGQYLFDCFLGIIPWANIEAVRYVRSCGARILCNVLCGSWNHKTLKNETGILFQYLRESSI